MKMPLAGHSRGQLQPFACGVALNSVAVISVARLIRLRKKHLPRRSRTSAAKSRTQDGAVTAALRRCATQKQVCSHAPTEAVCHPKKSVAASSSSAKLFVHRWTGGEAREQAQNFFALVGIAKHKAHAHAETGMGGQHLTCNS